jgi:hypothetical protein
VQEFSASFTSTVDFSGSSAQENPQRQETALGKQQIPQQFGLSFEEKDDKLFEGKTNT